MKITLLPDQRTLRLSFRYHAAAVAFAKSLVGGEYDKRSGAYVTYKSDRITPSALAFSRIAISRTAVLLIPNLAARASSKQRGEMELSTPPLTNLTLPCRAYRTVPDPALPDQAMPSLKRFWRREYCNTQVYFMQSRGGEVKGRLS